MPHNRFNTAFGFSHRVKQRSTTTSTSPRVAKYWLWVAKRRFLPNLQSRRFWIESENRFIRLRLSTAGIRLIDKNGIDVVLADLRERRVI